MEKDPSQRERPNTLREIHHTERGSTHIERDPPHRERPDTWRRTTICVCAG